MYDAIQAAPNGSTIKLPADTASIGLQVKSGSNLTFDLNGHELELVDQMAGSPCYETNGLHLLKDSTITIKNGTITSPVAKILVQNYSNLILDNVTLQSQGTTQYMLSCNFGNTVLKNNTTINATGDICAFDVYYGMLAKYDDGVSVTVQDSTVKVNGHIEFAHAGRVEEEDFRTKAHIYIPAEYELAAPAGFQWVPMIDGRQELMPIA